MSTVRGVHRARSRARECGSRGARREAPPSPWVGRLRAGTLFDARAARAVARRRDDVSRPFSISYSRSARRSRSVSGELDGDSRASSAPRVRQFVFPEATASPTGVGSTTTTHCVEAVKRSPVLDHPFEDVMYFSAVLPPRLYERAEEYFPPTAALRPAALSAHSKRYKVDGVRELMRLNSEAKDAFRNFSATVEAWSEVSRALSSDAFREALFEKLHVPDGLIARSHDFRMQIDVGGFTLGSHPDAPQKIVTMMLYFPKSPSDADTLGTCLHTRAQHERFERTNRVDECEIKFKFAPNTGYAFRVSSRSFHSVSVPEDSFRRTLLVNWYTTSEPFMNGRRKPWWKTVLDVLISEA